MSLSTLLEAAKYLDYLDANPQQSQEQRQQPQSKTQSPNQHEHSQHQAQLTGPKKSSRRQKSSKKDAANTMLAMSLPSSKGGAMQMHQGVPIPMTSAGGHYHQGASLSSSFTESPLSSFASTALLCSKASGVTSASSSAASSLSSSDSSSSCGEIMMGDNDFGQSPPSVSSRKTGNSQLSHSLTHQQQLMSTNNSQRLQNKFGNLNQSFAHYIAATSAGPQLVTMTTPPSTGMTSASAPIDGRIRAGHVIHAATNNGNVSGSPFDSRHYSIATTSGLHRNSGVGGGDGDSYGQLGTSLGATVDHLGSPPMIMARVQPMILNSISPSAHQSIMAFQQQTMTASSPTSSTSSYSRHRELHKTLEKNRRAHLRHCFELLKTELPASDCVDKKTSHINIIKSAIRYVLALRQQECEIDNELQRLTRVKSELTEKLSKVRNEQQQQQQKQQVIVDSKMQGIIDPSSLSPALSSQQQQQAHHNSQPLSPPSSSSATVEMKAEPFLFNNQQQQHQQQQQPAAEQQLSFLLSQSKID